MMRISEVFVLGGSRYPQMPKAQISSLASSHRGGYIGCEEDHDSGGHDYDDHVVVDHDDHDVDHDDQTEKWNIGCEE